MIDEKMREVINVLTDGQGVVFDNPAFDKSIVGITTDGSVVYNLVRMTREMSEEDNIPEEEALEFIEYNTIRALPYCRIGLPPVIIDYPLEFLLEERNALED